MDEPPHRTSLVQIKKLADGLLWKSSKSTEQEARTIQEAEMLLAEVALRVSGRKENE